MRIAIIGTLVALVLLASSSATARPHSAFNKLMKVGTEWKFERTLQEQDSPPKVNTEVWRIEEVEKHGKNAARIVFVVTELEPRERDHQVEHFVDGNRFFDVHWLDRLRPNPTASPEEVGKMLPLFDVKKASSRARTDRYPDNALAYVRYEKLKTFKANNGKTYRNVIYAMRYRGETFPTDFWWFDLKKGFVQMKLSFPLSSGGATLTWKRIN